MTTGTCCVVVTLLIAVAAADSTDFFLREIFQKYGNSGVITYEGFEHLLENLGIGRLEFDKSHSVALHRINGTFQEVHDQLRLHTHHHHHRRRRGIPDTDSPLELDLGIPPSGDDGDVGDGGDDGETSDVSLQQETPPGALPGPCLSAQELLRSHGLPTHHDVLISQPVFLHLCPAIVYEIDQRACYAAASATAESHVHQDVVGATAAAWLYATLSIAIISVSGIIGLIVVPLASKAYYHQVLSFLIATAVGTLCGDALLHMLPHALSVGDDHVAHAFHSLVVFGAMMFFYCMETVLRIHRANSYKKEIATKDLDVQQKIINSGETGSNLEVGIIMQGPERKNSFSRKHTHSHGLSTSIAGSHDHDVSSVAWVVIVGDGLHNLTDGLAIGTAFAGSTAAGLATAIAVFFHELPHELGDFAVLLQSGMSIRRAVVYNILSSVLSFLGMACGLWVGEYEDAAMWIYSATAGSFLYIALVDLLPEMNSSCEDPPTIKDLIIHILGIAVGGAIMLIIALYEEKLGTLFN
ncbi:zinc transporter ZIP10 [Schistocerca americana]|uniref:zinc transporter ZIP10 n=1 Tax=Schistocerca americana TaxID=7009 RepID=UPI001F4FFE84|nr:zinc transporter ZIP10 [Schistocerca americana]